MTHTYRATITRIRGPGVCVGGSVGEPAGVTVVECLISNVSSSSSQLTPSEEAFLRNYAGVVHSQMSQLPQHNIDQGKRTRVHSHG